MAQVTALLGDCIIFGFFLLKRKSVEQKEEWTREMKGWKRMWWRIRTSFRKIMEGLYI